MNRLNTNRKHKIKIKPLLLTGTLVLAAGLIVFAITQHHTKPVTLSVKTTSVTKRPTPAPNTVVKSPTPTPTTNVPGGLTGENDTSQATLTAPSGTFVSNHGQDGAHPVTLTTAEVSSCTTTPGASCYIKFTNNQTGATVDLSTEQTSTSSSLTAPSGTVSWNWTPQQANLTPGNWTIEAVATLDGQTKSTTDPTGLIISS